MKELSPKVQELLDLMNGCEVQSIKYRGCVGIKHGRVFKSGVIIDTLDTDVKVKKIWKEYIKGEGL